MFKAKVIVVTKSGVPLNVIEIDWPSVDVHVVETLALTITFLCVGNPSRLNEIILLEVKPWNSITLREYKNSLKSLPDVSYVRLL